MSTENGQEFSKYALVAKVLKICDKFTESERAYLIGFADAVQMRGDANEVSETANESN